jgi:hypothetical protein
MYAPAILSETARFSPLYQAARNRARLLKIKSFLSGRSRRLKELDDLLESVEIVSQHYLGSETVCIECIQGTESRNNDFDCEFNPLKVNNRERWIRIAAARLQDIGLPAIDLVQIGNIYYVRDGHHRVSVARALGAAYIDANVTVIKIREKE